MNLVYPAAFLANTFAVTGLMIALGLAGRPELAADFGIVHAATVALLHAFSGNARSIILNRSSTIPVATVLATRVTLLPPLGLLAWLLSSQLADVGALLALMLVLRRCAEWIVEPHLSAMELHNERRTVARFLVLQCSLSLLCAVWLIADLPRPALVLAAWASSPLWLSLPFVLRQVSEGIARGRGLLQLLPHFGSTAIIGISVYVFRLLLLLLVGKAVAGDLFTAFAIGGLLGSVFAQALGPTLVLQEARGGQAPRWLGIVLVAAALGGLALYAVTLFQPAWLANSGKSVAFWAATAISLAGGSLMVVAQRIRLRMLQQHADRDVFGPDVLANILIVAAVPYLYYLAGSDALGSLYLISALLSLVFYWSAEKGSAFFERVAPLRKPIALLLLFPLFFQLGGHVFRAPMHDYDAGGNLLLLPVPLSVIACYGGIALLGGYARARLSLMVIFATFTLMLVSSAMLAYSGGGQEQAKLILMIQFVLPMFALVLGQTFREDVVRERMLAGAFLGVLVLLVPLQLLATWLQGKLVVTPYLYLFSIHQNLQYVPSVFVAAYLFALYSLWQIPRRRPLLVAAGLAMAVYVASAVSTLGMITLAGGLSVLALHAAFRNNGARPLVALCLAAVVIMNGYFWLASGKTIFAAKYQTTETATEHTVALPQNVLERLNYWKFYGAAIFENAGSAALGHAVPPDRKQIRSAHNYFLDFAYNFGLIALLPLLALVAFTAVRVWTLRQRILESPPLLGLAVAVAYLVLLENMLKVGMRQPYPGIMTFFLWGLLLSHLRAPDADGRLKHTD